MRYPNYKEAHERAEKERLEKWRKEREEMKEKYSMNFPNFEYERNSSNNNNIMAQQAEAALVQQQRERERRKAQANLMEEMIKRILNGPPPSLRVIANIGPSTYDFTITRIEEIEMIQVLLHKFIDALTTKI